MILHVNEVRFTLVPTLLANMLRILLYYYDIYVRVVFILFIHDYGYDAYDDIYDAYLNIYYESNILIYWFIRSTMLYAGEEPGKVMEIS